MCMRVCCVRGCVVVWLCGCLGSRQGDWPCTLRGASPDDDRALLHDLANGSRGVRGCQATGGTLRGRTLLCTRAGARYTTRNAHTRTNTPGIYGLKPWPVKWSRRVGSGANSRARRKSPLHAWGGGGLGRFKKQNIGWPVQRCPIRAGRE